ncbi:hypothetical protein Ahy_B03g063433 [Arachis hypogaea]|uniref:Ethylene insensitive 3-like DNA-binding domain-containing protein n=1 Tax=Arachis hypogaea TaxID=3818 RepID=A0A444ZXR5_ARAHY|nr:hypothetical protein Ahy_B03g063433 [Arachis hypogaea]
MVQIHEEEMDVEGVDYEELKKRMWKDRMLLQKLKEKRPKHDDQEEASRRKKMARAQDSILKYMVKIMQVCNGQGFVYGIVTEKGKPITGSSESLREWWKDQVVNHQQSLSQITPPSPSSTETSKRKSSVFDFDDGGADIDDNNSKQMYACQNAECPQSELCMGFPDKNSRMNHESLCAYRTEQPHVLDDDTKLLDDLMNMDLAWYHDDNNHFGNEDLVAYELAETAAGATIPQDYGLFSLNAGIHEDLGLHASSELHLEAGGDNKNNMLEALNLI